MQNTQFSTPDSLNKSQQFSDILVYDEHITQMAKLERFIEQSIE
jgi:hypothetical protein